MSVLDDAWPDPDRRDEALERLARNLQRGGIAPRHGDNEFGLSPMEIRCLRAASYGQTTVDTGALFGLSPASIASHLRWARRRLRAKTTAHAVAEALRHDLIA